MNFLHFLQLLMVHRVIHPSSVFFPSGNPSLRYISKNSFNNSAYRDQSPHPTMWLCHCFKAYKTESTSRSAMASSLLVVLAASATITWSSASSSSSSSSLVRKFSSELLSEKSWRAQVEREWVKDNFFGQNVFYRHWTAFALELAYCKLSWLQGTRTRRHHPTYTTPIKTIEPFKKNSHWTLQKTFENYGHSEAIARSLCFFESPAHRPMTPAYVGKGGDTNRLTFPLASPPP